MCVVLHLRYLEFLCNFFIASKQKENAVKIEKYCVHKALIHIFENFLVIWYLSEFVPIEGIRGQIVW